MLLHARRFLASIFFALMLVFTSPLSVEGSGTGQPAPSDPTRLPSGAIARLGSPAFRQGGRITGLAMLPGCKQILTAGDDNLLSWNIESGRLLGTIDKLPAPTGIPGATFTGAYPAGWGLTGLALTTDGTVLFTSGFDSLIHAWDVGTAKALRSTKLSQAVRSLALSPNGKTLAAGLAEGKIILLDPKTLQEVGTLQAGKERNTWLMFALTFATDGVLVSRDSGHSLRVWDVVNQKELYTMDCGRVSNWLVGLAVSPDGKKVASPFNPRRIGLPTAVGIWEVGSGKLLDTLDLKFTPQTVAYLPDGKSLVVGDMAGKVWVVDLEKKAVRRTFEGHRGAVLSLAVAPDGKSVASGSADTTVLVWDLTKPVP